MSRAEDLNVDAYLSRSDKWYLGGGDRLVWTPRYPEWLEMPGFWDEAHYYHHEISPVFAVTLLDEQGVELPLHASSRRWRPSHLLQSYRSNDGISAAETRAVLPNDALVSELKIRNDAGRDRVVQVVAWTMVANDPNGEQRLRHRSDEAPPPAPSRAIHTWGIERHPEGEPHAAFECALGIHPRPAHTATVQVEEAPFQPRWSLTPFYDAPPGLSPLSREQLGHERGPIYVALYTSLAIPRGAARTARVAFSAGPEASEASRAVQVALECDDLASDSRENWADFFSSVPAFSCSDPHLQKYYWYRWYGLNLFTTRKPEGNFAHPAVYEGPGYFRKLITYSAQCHMLEMRWMQDPSTARGSLLNFLKNQRPDGSFFGHLFTGFGHEESFYHANWGNAWDVHLLHPDEDFLRSVYEGLSRYLAYFQAKRDPEDSGLYDILNHYETGQEYMHRYVAVDEAADQVHWGENFRLKGVDVATYIYAVKRLLARIAGVLKIGGEESRWNAAAERTAVAMRNQMWDSELQMFSDVDPRSSRRTNVKAAVCFYPYMTDVVREEHVAGLKQHLLNPKEFWSTYPVPSSSMDDPYFSARPFWKGRRMNCPWNGRVWPMANSHVAEALAQSAIRFDDAELRERAAEFIERFVRMMFFDDAPDRPNCFEHYDPLIGKASVYRGVDDYQHSWVVDLIIKYVCGIRPSEQLLTIDPFPFDLEHFRIDDVAIRGRRVAVEREHDRFRVWVDGREAGESRLGEPLRIPLETVAS